MKINGSKILITGGSLGFGKATAQALVEGGADVIITGRDNNRLSVAARPGPRPSKLLGTWSETMKY